MMSMPTKTGGIPPEINDRATKVMNAMPAINASNVRKPKLRELLALSENLLTMPSIKLNDPPIQGIA
jgi:hypothetical protein